MMNTLAYEETKTRARALSEEDRQIVIKTLPTDMLYIEIDKRIETAQKLISGLYDELAKIKDTSTLQDYELVINNCSRILRGDLHED